MEVGWSEATEGMEGVSALVCNWLKVSNINLQPAEVELDEGGWPSKKGIRPSRTVFGMDHANLGRHVELLCP